MEQYLIDTNAVCHYFSASFSDKGMQFMDMVIDAVPNISVITQIELLCWKTDVATEKKVKSFIRDSVILNISPDIIDYCVSLRRDMKIKTPDAIIASTALDSGFSLITCNEKDFENVKSLEIINPKQL